MYRYPFTLHYACFNCRKSFRRESGWDVKQAVCPNCGGISRLMGRRFKVPRRQNRKAWQGLERLTLAGYGLSHNRLKDPEQFLDNVEQRILAHDPKRRFLLTLTEAPQQDRKPAQWRPPKKRKPVKR